MKKPLWIASLVLALGNLLSPSAFAQNGWNWSSLSSGTTENLLGISMYSPDFGVAVGNNRTVLHWNGSAWSPFAGLNDTGFNAASSFGAVSVINPSLVLIGGSQGSDGADRRGLSVWDGASWSAKIDATGSAGAHSVSGIWSDRSGLVLTARSYATWITRYDGDNDAGDLASNTNWSLAYNTGGSSLLALHGSSSSAVFAVGIGGLALRSSDEGASWSSISGPEIAGTHWYSVFSLSATQTWIGGVNSNIAYWNGTTWSNEVITFNAKSVVWRDILALDANNVWAVGDAGAVKYFDGSQWSDIFLDGVGNTNLTSITYDGSALWLTGHNGLIYRAIPEPSVAVLAVAGLLALGLRGMKAAR